MQSILRLFSLWQSGLQYCFNIASREPLNETEIQILVSILGDGFSGRGISMSSMEPQGLVIEIGPRSITPWSSNFVSMCQAINLPNIVRVEKTRRYSLPHGVDQDAFVSAHCDRMTERVYVDPLDLFSPGISPEPVFTIPLIEEGPDAFLRFDGLNKLSPEERKAYYDYFVGKEHRNPTIVEMLDLLNANSEHSRHPCFKGRQIIDGELMSRTLMQTVQSPYLASPGNSIAAFADNSSGVTGYEIRAIGVAYPGQPSPYTEYSRIYHIINTAETHNHPTGISPFPGSATGGGGRMRDLQAFGRGGMTRMGAIGFLVGDLHMPGYHLPWEREGLSYPPGLASALEIALQGKNGGFDYANKFGEPGTSGFFYSYCFVLPNGERWEPLKPVMWSGGSGLADAAHVTKGDAVKGMLIVQVGGPAYRVGKGGGFASSLKHGDNEIQLDFDSVQRGDGEMKRKLHAVILTCIAMGDRNPIISAHDQGAGGPANVLKELVEKAGGRIELRRITVGDPSMAVVDIWICEYQERNGFLIAADGIEEFMAICAREKVNCEVLGEVTGDGRFTVHDESDDSCPVDFELAEVLGGMPQQTFSDTRIPLALEPLQLPESLTVAEAVRWVLRLASVGSKEWLIHGVDRSVGGHVVRDQTAGPLLLPVSDYAISALSYLSPEGMVTAVGVRPTIMLIDPKKGARMTVGEAVTNMAGAVVRKSSDIWSSANWMWDAKLPGGGAALWDAVSSLSDCVNEVGMAKPNRGKDSLTMATAMSRSCRNLVLYAYAPMNNVQLHVTPDFKCPGESVLIHIDLANGKCRLGGSALAQVYGQFGNDPPDMDDPQMVRNGFAVMQRLVAEGKILAAHDISDGGLIVTMLEMAFAGDCGLLVDMAGPWNPIDRLFAEELGWVVECHRSRADAVLGMCATAGLSVRVIGSTLEGNRICITSGSSVELEDDVVNLRHIWRETSYQLKRLESQACADAESTNLRDRPGLKFYLPDQVIWTPPSEFDGTRKFDVAILREEGSNGYEEMAAAFHAAGFTPWDVHMSDLVEERITLDRFRGVVAVGGFSYADVPESAKGWAATIRFNPRLKAMFEGFLNRPDTFSLGVCNGCQFFGLLGVVPIPGLSDFEQPTFGHNESAQFESRFLAVKILRSPAIMLRGMEGAVLGIHSAHGEGRVRFPEEWVLQHVISGGLAPIRYVDDDGAVTTEYPFNPNGSMYGIAGLCTPDGRHLAMMPHPERAFLDRQWPWMPGELKSESGYSAWMQMFVNARRWCEQNG